MKLFDVSNYESRIPETIDWKRTKEKLGFFLAKYKSVRERVGLAPLPKIIEGHHMNDNDRKQVEKMQNERNSSQQVCAFLEMHDLFSFAYTAIHHPFRPDITERRRHIFLLRYLYGLSVDLTSERVCFQKNVVIDESKMAVVQFCSSLGILAQHSFGETDD